MSRIDIHNYEAYYLDYIEGNLNDELKALLLQFLDQHPKIKQELEGFEIIELPKDDNIIFEKDNLHINIDKENVEEYIIASIENVLNKDDQEDLEKYINSSDDAKKLFNRYEKTILAKQKIIYPDKEKLKRKNLTLYYLSPMLGAAAVILFFLFYNPSPSINNNVEQNQVSMLEDEVDSNRTNINLRDSSIIDEVKEQKQILTPQVAEIIKPETIKKNVIKKVTPIVQEKLEIKKEISKYIKVENINIAINKDIKREKDTSYLEEEKIIPESIGQIEKDILVENNTGVTDQNTDIKTTEKIKTSNLRSRKQLLWKLAEIGIKGFNKLNETNYDVKPTFTSSGELKSVTLITEKRRITAPTI